MKLMIYNKKRSGIKNDKGRNKEKERKLKHNGRIEYLNDGMHEYKNGNFIMIKLFFLLTASQMGWER